MVNFTVTRNRTVFLPANRNQALGLILHDRDFVKRPVLIRIYIVPSGEELHIELDNITTQDVEVALKHTKPSVLGLQEKYAAWQKDYESV